MAQFLINTSIQPQDDNGLFNRYAHIVRDYLYWCFRKSFMGVLISESFIFLVWCWLFAVLYYFLGRLNPECIRGPNEINFEEGDMGLVDAFTLSWSTFSTVVCKFAVTVSYWGLIRCFLLFTLAHSPSAI